MPVLELNSYEEFIQRTEDKDFEICTYIFTGIKKGYVKKYNKVKVFDMVMKTDPLHKYSFSLERSEWKTALVTCIESYAERELYEECTEIKALLDSI